MNKRLSKTIHPAMFAAFLSSATLIIRIPSPLNGYVNLGDCFILASAWFLGPVYGFAAGSIGSALADLIAGYPVYIPGTFIIKGMLAVTAALITHRINTARPESKFIGYAAGGAAAEVVMIGGYYLYEAILYGFAPALTGIPGNVVQGVCGAVAGIALVRALSAVGVTKYLKAYAEIHA